MSTLEQAEQLLSRMTAGEKAQLLQLLARAVGVFPGIERQAGVCGGDPCIVRTRIPVWVLEQARRLGASDIDLLASYPSLRPEDLSIAWAFVAAHRDEIDVQIRENEEA